jgi:hypothetical protein
MHFWWELIFKGKIFGTLLVLYPELHLHQLQPLRLEGRFCRNDTSKSNVKATKAPNATKQDLKRHRSGKAMAYMSLTINEETTFWRSRRSRSHIQLPMSGFPNKYDHLHNGGTISRLYRKIKTFPHRSLESIEYLATFFVFWL